MIRWRPAVRAIGCEVTVTPVAFVVSGIAARLSIVRLLIPDDVSVEKTYAPVVGTVRRPVQIAENPLAPPITDGPLEPQLKFTVGSVRTPSERFGSPPLVILYAPCSPCIAGPGFPL